MEPPPMLSLVFLAGGALGIFYTLLRTLKGGGAVVGTSRSPQTAGKWALAGLVVILITATLLRLSGIADRGMTHVEVYVPGIHLPADISTPPPRQTLGELLWYHFHDEPHPQGYYLLMHAWTGAFGTSVAALRLPSLIFNVLSIALLFALVRREAGWKPALFAAVLMACHGHQIYWSQQARMYAMGEFFGLLSTWFLLSIIRGDQRASARLLYVATAWAGVATQIFFWPFLAAQMLLVSCLRHNDGSHNRVLYRLQACVVILGTPFWTHALYRARSAPLLGPSTEFAGQFFGLGFLFDDDLFSLPPLDIPLAPWLLSIILTGAGIFLGRGKSEPPSGPAQNPLAFSTLGVASLATAIFICGLAAAAYSRRPYLYLSSVLPLAALALPWFQEKFGDLAGSRLAVLFARHRAMVFLTLGVTPFLLLFALGAVSPLLKTRGMITFVPFLIGAVAIGWSKLFSRPVAVIVVLVMFAWPLYESASFFNNRPEPNAHRDITDEIRSRLEEDDLIFVKKNDWVTTPSFYYLYDERERLVAEDWEAKAKQSPASRIWVLTYSDIPAEAGIRKAINSRKLLDTRTARRCQAMLYDRQN